MTIEARDYELLSAFNINGISEGLTSEQEIRRVQERIKKTLYYQYNLAPEPENAIYIPKLHVDIFLPHRPEENSPSRIVYNVSRDLTLPTDEDKNSSPHKKYLTPYNLIQIPAQLYWDNKLGPAAYDHVLKLWIYTSENVVDDFTYFVCKYAIGVDGIAKLREHEIHLFAAKHEEDSVLGSGNLRLRAVPPISPEFRIPTNKIPVKIDWHATAKRLGTGKNPDGTSVTAEDLFCRPYVIAENSIYYNVVYKDIAESSAA